MRLHPVLLLASACCAASCVEDPAPPKSALETKAPFARPALRTLAGVSACDTYLDTRCTTGKREICETYDAATSAFTATPDPMAKRAFLYDRWYDRYHSPDGLASNRSFNGPTPAGTPEAQWGAPAHFDHYDGTGDAAIWTGVAANGAMLRYLVTRTDADRDRFETKVKELLALFEVTGIPGYLARSHSLQIPADAPATDEHLVGRTGALDHHDFPIEPASLSAAPASYATGYDVGGKHVTGTPMWRGNPSIDQYTGAMTVLPAAWALTTDTALKGRISRQLTCYLNRLHRLDIVNLQQNEEALGAIRAFFSADRLVTEPGDLDYAALDQFAIYYLPRFNKVSAKDFDRSCPAGPARAPERTIDAAAPDFPVQMLDLAAYMDSEKDLAGSMDHGYLPGVRGGDAVHMLHLAAMAYAFTGDEAYRKFVDEDLLGSLQVLRAAHTTGAFSLPDWCKSFYGDHITSAPMWAIVNLLASSPLRDEIRLVLQEEGWHKLYANQGNAKFDLMFAMNGPDAATADRAAAKAEGLAILRAFGGNGGVLDDPRRNYSVSREALIAKLGEGGTRCPTEADRVTCEAPVKIYGIPVPRDEITQACTGGPGECKLGAKCAPAYATKALAPNDRPFDDFTWQRNPFRIGVSYAPEGTDQSPGLDFTETYWLGRQAGFIEEGKDLVLAWKESGACD